MRRPHICSPYRKDKLPTSYNVPAGAAYKDSVRIQLNSESLQEFAAAVEQLAHQALVGLPVDFIQREAAHAFVG
jgi:hypothetical protein